MKAFRPPLQKVLHFSPNPFLLRSFKTTFIRLYKKTKKLCLLTMIVQVPALFRDCVELCRDSVRHIGLLLRTDGPRGSLTHDTR